MVIPIGSLQAAQQMSHYIHLKGTEHYESSAAYALAIETAEGTYMRTCVTYNSIKVREQFLQLGDKKLRIEDISFKTIFGERNDRISAYQKMLTKRIKKWTLLCTLFVC